MSETKENQEAEVPSTAQPDDEAEAQQTRSLLSGLGPVSTPLDLSARVPRLIERRSQGRFFGRKPLYARVSFVWLSVLMLLTMALLYAVLHMAPGVVH